MGNRRLSAATIAVLTGTTTLAVGAATPAHAAGTTLAITSVGDMLVDGEHQRIFITDPAGGKVLATDYSGKPLGSATVTDATSLELSRDSSRLYVTSPKGSAIVALDPGTLDEVAKYSTGTTKPKDVALAGGRLWFSYADGIPGKLGTVDPADPTADPVLNRFTTGWTGVAELATAAGAPDRLGLASLGMTAILDVAGDTITTVGSVTTNQDVDDMALFPDGSRIATVYPGDEWITVRTAGDFANPRELRMDAYPVAVDIAADGTVIGGLSSYNDTPDGFVFTAAGDLIKDFDLPILGQVEQHGVAWEPNGSRLFSVSANGPTFTLHSWTDARQSPTRVSFSGPPGEIVPGAPVTLTGSLITSVALPAGTTVTISRGTTELGTVPVAADGSFTLTDNPGTEGSVGYRVAYAGDAFHSPAGTTTSVWIAKVRSNLTLAGPSTAVPGARVTVTGSLTSSVSLPAGIAVPVTRDGTALGTATVAADGSFSVADTPAAEGTVVYQVSYPGDDTHLPATASFSVQVSRAASTITLTGPSSATRAKALTITGTLASPHTLTAGTKVSVSRTDLESPAGKSLGTRTVGAGGTFTVTDTPAAGGTVTYRVSYAGDATHTAAAATKAIAVSRATPAVTLTNKGKVYDYGKTVSFTAHLGSTYKNRTVEIWADPAGGDQARRLLKRGTVNSKGNLSASIKLTRNTTVSAVFTGDARYAPRTVTVSVGTRANLTLRLSQYYKTKKIGGTSYRHYRPGKTAYFLNSVAGASSRQVRIQLQRYSGGKWKNYDDNWFAADDKLYLQGEGLTNVRLRIRSGYVNGSSGDTLNTSVWTPYQYFIFK